MQILKKFKFSILILILILILIFFFFFFIDFYFDQKFFFNEGLKWKGPVLKIIREDDWDKLNEVNLDNLDISKLSKDYNDFLDKLILDKNVDAYKNEQSKYFLLQDKVAQAKLNSDLKLLTFYKKHPDFDDLIIRDLALCHKCADEELLKFGLLKKGQSYNNLWCCIC